MTQAVAPRPNGQNGNTKGQALSKIGDNIGFLDTYLSTKKDLIARACGGILNVDRMLRVAVNCVTRTPGLRNTTPVSILRAVLQATELGLVPGSISGHAYLVPYGDVCQLIVGYKGYVKLLYDAGVREVMADCVYKDDEFSWQRGLHPDITHKPSSTPRDPKNITHAYAIIYLATGHAVWQVMDRGQIDSVRARSRASSNGPWVTDYPIMAMKTVLRFTTKFAPQNDAIDKAYALDNAVDTGDPSVMEFDILEANAPLDSEIEQKDAVTSATTAKRGVDAVKSKLPTKSAEVTEDAPQTPPLSGRERFVQAAKEAAYPIQSDEDARSLAAQLLAIDRAATPTDEQYIQAMDALLKQGASEKLFDNE